MKITWNLEILKQGIEEYFYAEEEYRKFATARKTPKGWEPKTAKESVDYTILYEQNQEKWNTVQMMCQMVNIGSNGIIPIMKAIRRWEVHNGKWDRNIHLCRMAEESEENLMKLIGINENRYEIDDSKYYQSTGRKILA